MKLVPGPPRLRRPRLRRPPLRRPSLRLLLLFPAAGLTLPACTNIDALVDADLGQVQAAVDERVGQRPPAWSADPSDTALPEAARALLEGELTEDAAVQVALLNNRDVRAAYESVGIARAGLVQAGLLSNPVFGADAHFFLDGGTELEFGLTQTFLDLFHRPLRQRVAANELAAATARVTHELVHLAFAVRRAFVRLRAAQQLVELQESALAAAAASLELMERLHAAGNVTDPLLTSERVGASRARLDLAAAEQAAREAREELCVWMGLWGADVAFTVSGRLPESVVEGVELERVESLCVAASLDLAENRAAIDAAAQRAGLVSWRPWTGGDGLGAGARREPGGEWGFGPSLRLGLPLFDPGRAADAAARAALRQRLHHHVQTAVKVRSAARLLRDRLALLGERVRFLRAEHLPAQSRLVRETLQNYNAMQIGAFEVLARRGQQIAAGREYLSTLRDAWLARLDLQELLAGSLPEAALEPRWPGIPAGRERSAGAGH